MRPPAAQLRYQGWRCLQTDGHGSRQVLGQEAADIASVSRVRRATEAFWDLEVFRVHRMTPDKRCFRPLTFDMSGGPRGAKRPLERPLDGRVSRHVFPEVLGGAPVPR